MSMETALRTVEEIFGEPLPPLSEEQKLRLQATLNVQIDVLFSGPRQQRKLRTRNRVLAKRVLLDGISLKEAAKEFSISDSRVSQLRLKAIRMLRQPLRSRPLRVLFGKPKLVIVVEDNGCDEGCTHDVMQAYVNHGFRILEARFENPDGTSLDVIHLAQYVTKEEGKC